MADRTRTFEELRCRRAEILQVAHMRRAIRIAVFGSVAEKLLGVRVDVVSRRTLGDRDERIRAEAVEL